MLAAFRTESKALHRLHGARAFVFLNPSRQFTTAEDGSKGDHGSSKDEKIDFGTFLVLYDTGK
jgi:hypothetical protein